MLVHLLIILQKPRFSNSQSLRQPLLCILPMSSLNPAGFRHGCFTLEQAWKWEKGEVSFDTLIPVRTGHQSLLPQLEI